jgi:hypothetical protein
VGGTGSRRRFYIEGAFKTTDSAAASRIRCSQIVLAGWLAMDRPTGHLPELLAMIQEELVVLGQIAQEFPHHARDVGDLIECYRRYASDLRTMAN